MQAIATQLTTIETTTQRLVGAAAGLVERAAVARFKTDAMALYRRAHWPDPAAKARNVAIYVLVTELSLDHEDVAHRYGMQKRASQRAVQRIAEERDQDAGLDNFLTELSDAMRER